MRLTLLKKNIRKWSWRPQQQLEQSLHEQIPHIPQSCISLEAPESHINKNGRKHIDPDTSSDTEEETGKDPEGGKEMWGPGANISSGFGGLGLEGIKGCDESVGERPSPPPGEGNRGLSISGERAGAEGE